MYIFWEFAFLDSLEQSSIFVFESGNVSEMIQNVQPLGVCGGIFVRARASSPTRAHNVARRPNPHAHHSGTSRQDAQPHGM